MFDLKLELKHIIRPKLHNNHIRDQRKSINQSNQTETTNRNGRKNMELEFRSNRHERRSYLGN